MTVHISIEGKPRQARKQEDYGDAVEGTTQIKKDSSWYKTIFLTIYVEGEMW